MYRSHGASSLNRSDEAASAHSITSSARPRDQMPNVAWFPIPLLAAHGRDIQALTKARRLSSGTFCSLACLRQADRFCRSATSFWRIALRVAASAVVRAGFMPLSGAVVLVAQAPARVATGLADAAIRALARSIPIYFMAASAVCEPCILCELNGIVGPQQKRVNDVRYGSFAPDPDAAGGCGMSASARKRTRRQSRHSAEAMT